MQDKACDAIALIFACNPILPPFLSPHVHMLSKPKILFCDLGHENSSSV